MLDTPSSGFPRKVPGKRADKVTGEPLRLATNVTNVRNLGLPRWKRLTAEPHNHCLNRLTEFCEWTPDEHKVGNGALIQGKMWSDVPTGRGSPSPVSGSGPTRA
jgi:hypothetical protein